MKQGTVSILFGCHSIVHSFYVVLAWHYLYKAWPKFWELCCILLHDVGHWNLQYLDNYEEKKTHARLGARVAEWLFGFRAYYLVAGHNPYEGTPRSALHDPDKYSWILASELWMISNTWFEPKLIRKGCTRRESVKMFKEAIQLEMAKGFKGPAHEIYLKQWGHYNEVN